MKIIRIYNNNILSANRDGEEVIITGNGIGFGKKVNDLVDSNKIDKIYTFKDQQKSQLQDLLAKVPVIYFRIAEVIAEKAAKALNISLSNQILISLSDHIGYAIERKKNNQHISNLMLNEIKSIYKKEFKVGLWALKVIEANTKIVLDEDEAGYIAMHIVNATIGNENNITSMILRFIKDIQRVIEKNFSITFEQQTLNYSRLVTHLKFLGQHIFNNENKKIENLDHLYDMLINCHPLMYPCIDEISKITKEKYQYQLEKYELVYLMIHLSKIVNENES